jgi:hypothetical protein
MEIPITGIDIENFRKYLIFVAKQFENESMRGAIALGLAWIDFALEDILRHYLIGKDNMGFLDRKMTIGAKIELAYRIGIVSNQLHDDLCDINKIRNKLIHLKKKKDTLSIIFWEQEDIQQRARRIVEKFVPVINGFPTIRRYFTEDELNGDFEMVLGIIIHYFWFWHSARIKQADIEPFYRESYKSLLNEKKKQIDQFWQKLSSVGKKSDEI